MKNIFNRKICFDEYRNINGIEQYLMHCGTSYDNPVMLYLHGSGLAESIYAYTFQKRWEEIYTVVHLDQRGIGKTFTRNPNEIPTVEKIIEDIHEVVKYLKEKYNKDKIVLFGHSFGTLLGSIYIQKYPEDVSYYIGNGQVTSLKEGEHEAFEELKKVLLQNNDVKALSELKRMDDDYPLNQTASQYFKSCMKFKKLQQKYNMIENFFTLSYFMQFFKSPVFKFSDITAMMKCGKVGDSILDAIYNFNIKSLSLDYKVPVYYILGEKDWQTPTTMAKKYFNDINAPRKKLYVIPNTYHATMYNDPDAFYEALEDINRIEK